MLSSAQFSQPSLPGLEGNDTPRAQRAKAVAPFVEHERSKWSGAIPGQQVMGVHDLGGDGPRRTTYEIDKTGMVGESHVVNNVTDHEPARPTSLLKGPPTTAPERHIFDSSPARYLYASHGGARSQNVVEAHADRAREMGYGDDVHRYLQVEEGLHPIDVQKNIERTKALHAHWASQPLHQVRTDAPIHTAQSAKETETQKPTSTGLRQSLQNGEDIREPAWLVKKAGRLYALDAHHRMHAARQEGRETFPARVWDWDAENRPKQGKPGAAAKAVAAMPKPRGL